VLKQSWEDVLRRTGFQDPTNARVKRSAIAIWADACHNRTPMCKQGIDAMAVAYLARFQLDVNGRANLSGVPTGTVWIVALGRTTNKHLAWNVPLEIKPGTNTIKFGKSNVAIIY